MGIGTGFGDERMAIKNIIDAKPNQIDITQYEH
jgi:hypothetical protein